MLKTNTTDYFQIFAILAHRGNLAKLAPPPRRCSKLAHVKAVTTFYCFCSVSVISELFKDGLNMTFRLI